MTGSVASRPCFLRSGVTDAVLNFAGKVACSKDRLASLVITCVNVYLQALSSEVGTKSSGDDLGGINPINLATSSSVTEGNADS